MSVEVEGVWKEFIFKFIGKEDYPGILEHVKISFYQDSPLSVVTGTSEAKLRDIDKVVTAALDDGLSFAVYEQETGKVAGVRLTTRCKKLKTSIHLESDEYKTVRRFVDAAEEGIDIFEKYKVEEYADLFIASVDRQFRGEGVATEMYRRVIPLLKDRGFKLAKSSFTSPFTMKIADRYGFEEVARKYLREVQNSAGEYTHPHLGEDQFLAVKCLRL